MTVVYNFQACPFCRVRAGEMHRIDDDFFVECQACGAIGPMCSTEALAAERWNRNCRPRKRRGTRRKTRSTPQRTETPEPRK